MIKNLLRWSKPASLRYYFIISTILMASGSYSQVTNEWNRLIEYSDGLSYENDFVNSKFAGIVDIAKDAAGNVYVTGAANGINVNETYLPKGSRIIYARKYNPSGSLIWEKSYSTNDPEILLSATGITVTDNGIVYVVGYRTRSGVTTPEMDLVIRYNSLDNNDNGKVGTSIYNYTPSDLALDPAGNLYVTGTLWITGQPFRTSYHTQKYDADLNLLWSRLYGESDSYANALAVGSLGNVYVTGKSGRSTNHEIVTVQYTQDGDLIGIARITGTANFQDEAYDVAVDVDNNAYVTGYVTDGTPGEVGTYNQMYTTIKYDAAFTQLWINKYDCGGDFDEGLLIATDGGGNIVVTGRSGNDSPISDDDIVTIKYDPTNGTRQWVKRYLGPALPKDIEPDGLGNFYITGSGVDDFFDIITFKYDATGNEKWRIVYTSPVALSYDLGQAMVVDATGNIYVGGSANDAGILVKYIQCNLTCPGNIVVNNTSGQCGAIVNYSAASASPTCGTPTYSIASGTFFPVGQTTVTVSSATGEATCSFTVTVNDSELPIITAAPANVTVSCAADIPAVNTAGITATDNCGTPVITHVGDVISNQTCANRYVLTRTYKATDASSNWVTRDQVITVNDNTPPQIIGLSLSQQVLWPANHTLRDITINYDVADNCTTPTVSVTVSSNESVNGTGDGDTDPDWIIVDAHHVKVRSERSATGDGRIYTIAVTVSDGCNASVTQSKTVIVAHNITGPITGRPFRVGSTVDFTGVFWDKAGNKHTGQWLIDDNITVKGIITEPSGNRNGKVIGSYKFNTAGVYKVQMNITDQNKLTSYTNTNGDLEEIVVIYDPDGGYAYGGGWFHSPAGAIPSHPLLTGKVSYGFTANYFKGATYPKGETQFEFKVGAFEFNALNFDYLSINGIKAQLKGSGKIVGGQSGVNFIATVIDGQLDGTGIDKLRMKIFNKNTGVIYYDNEPGKSEAASPSTAVGGNSTINISSTAIFNSTSSLRTVPLEQEIDENPDQLMITAYPNPSRYNFKIRTRSPNKIDKITVQVIDVYGRVIETGRTVPDQTFIFGERYRPGTYIVKVTQAKQQRQLKLIKISGKL